MCGQGISEGISSVERVVWERPTRMLGKGSGITVYRQYYVSVCYRVMVHVMYDYV